MVVLGEMSDCYVKTAIKSLFLMSKIISADQIPASSRRVATFDLRTQSIALCLLVTLTSLFEGASQDVHRTQHYETYKHPAPPPIAAEPVARVDKPICGDPATDASRSRGSRCTK